MAVQGNRSSLGSSDDTIFFAFVVGMVALALNFYIVWQSFHTEISGYVASYIHAQIQLLQLWTNDLDVLDKKVVQANMRLVTLHQIYKVLSLTGSYLRYPGCAIMAALAVCTFVWAPPNRHTKDLDIDSLAIEHGRTYLPVRAFAQRKLKLVPLLPEALRPCDPALTTAEWLSRFAPSKGGGIDGTAARSALSAQVGPVWLGADKATPLVQYLFAVFALHLEQRRAPAQELLGKLANALPVGIEADPAGPADFYPMPATVVSAAGVLLRDPKLRARADEIAAVHAYTVPALMSVLIEARRRSGVLAPAQFGSVKLMDRGLWYALHSLGFEGDGPGQKTHPNPRIEAAGVRDHWACERAAGRPLIDVHVANALDAVRAVFGKSFG